MNLQRFANSLNIDLNRTSEVRKIRYFGSLHISNLLAVDLFLAVFYMGSYGQQINDYILFVVTKLTRKFMNIRDKAVDKR